MIKLSFSTINSCLQPENSHNWLNKVMGLKPEDKPYYHEGTEAHRIIQQHVCGKELHPALSHIEQHFDIVEEVDFDKRCEFQFDLRKVAKSLIDPSSPAAYDLADVKDDYLIRGFHDGKDKKLTKFLEIKSSSTPWSLGKFQRAMQRKLYGLPYLSLVESYLITGKRNPSEWENEPPKIYKVPVTNQDRIDAIEWIIAAIKRLESGDLHGGLDENGKCTDRWCYYGENCQFK